MIMINKNNLIALGFGTSQSADIIRKAKRLMSNKGFKYYDNRKLSLVPLESVEEILGVKLDIKGGLESA